MSIGKRLLRPLSVRHRRRLRLAAVLSAVALAVGVVLVPAAAHAYTKTGCRWSSSTVSWGNYTAGTDSTAAQKAAIEWAWDTDVNGMAPTGGQMKVFSKNYGNNQNYGYTWWSCSWWGTYTWASVTLNTHYTANYSVAKKQAIWVHEFGHALGLNHSQFSNNMMWHCAPCVFDQYGYYTPQGDDIAGMNTIY